MCPSRQDFHGYVGKEIDHSPNLTSPLPSHGPIPWQRLLASAECQSKVTMGALECHCLVTGI